MIRLAAMLLLMGCAPADVAQRSISVPLTHATALVIRGGEVARQPYVVGAVLRWRGAI